MKKSNKSTKHLIAGTLMLAMVVSLLPIQVAKAEESNTFNPDSIAWVPLPENERVSTGTSGITGFTNKGGMVYYAIVDGEYYFKLADSSEISVDSYYTIPYKNPLGKDPYGIPFYSYLRTKDGSIHLIEGACESSRISFDCGNTSYGVQSAGNVTLAKATDTYYQLIVPSTAQASYSYKTTTGVEVRIPSDSNAYLETGTHFIGNNPDDPSGAYTTQWDNEKAKTRKPVLSTATKEATDAIDAATNLTDAQKEAAKNIIAKMKTDGDKVIEDAISKAELDRATVDYVKGMNAIADIAKAASDTNKTIDTLPSLTDDEKTELKKKVDSTLKDVIDAIPKAEDKEKVKEDGLKAIADVKNNAQKKSDENAAKDKAQTDANKFIDDLLKDENGEIIKTVNEVTVIKIIESIEHWNTLDQTTKDYINQILLEKIGKTYEQLVDEAKTFAAATDQKLNDDFDSGSLIAKVKKTTTNSTTLSWTKVKGADGYIIYSNFCNTNEKKNKFKKLKDVKGDNKTSYKVTKRKTNKWYKYRVVAYKIVDGKQVILGQSLVLHACNANKSFKYANPTGVKAKKSSFSLAAGKTATIKASLVMPKGKKYNHHTAYKVRYIVSDKSIATVSKKGKITAKKTGTCYIYACAQNGVYKKIKVTVK